MKIALIYQKAIPHWVSVKSIRDNLIKSYEELDAELIHLQYTEHSGIEVEAFAAVDFIIFLESHPLPIPFLKKLPDHKKILFHLYGDFTLFLHNWKSIEDHLKDKQIRFLVASPKQLELVSEIIDKKYLGLCPFPIDPAEFYPELNQDQNQNKPFVITMAGRFSTQKNSLLACLWLAEFAEKTKSSFEVHIAGTFDDYGAPLWGVSEPFGFQYFCWNEFLKKQNNKRISFTHVGQLNKHELQLFFSKSDLHLGLSTYHDEDFGMAPLEALMCGSRALLTNWGGLSQFALDQDSISLVDVVLLKEGLKLEKDQFFKHLGQMIINTISDEERLWRHLFYAFHFSYSSISKVIAGELHSSFHTFTGFKEISEQYSVLCMLHQLKGEPVYGGPRKADELYHKLYRHYI